MSTKKEFNNFITGCILRAMNEFGPEVKVSIAINLGSEYSNGLNIALTNVDDVSEAIAFVTKQCVKCVFAVLASTGMQEADAIEKTADLMQITAENSKRLLEAMVSAEK